MQGDIEGSRRRGKKRRKGGECHGKRGKRGENRPTYANNESSALPFEYLKHIRLCEWTDRVWIDRERRKANHPNLIFKGRSQRGIGNGHVSHRSIDRITTVRANSQRGFCSLHSTIPGDALLRLVPRTSTTMGLETADREFFKLPRFQFLEFVVILLERLVQTNVWYYKSRRIAIRIE